MLQPLEVLLVQIVVLGKDVSGRVVDYLVHIAMREKIPDGWPTALVLCSSFKPGTAFSIPPLVREGGRRESYW
jgi:hypothetical protein